MATTNCVAKQSIRDGQSNIDNKCDVGHGDSRGMNPSNVLAVPRGMGPSHMHQHRLLLNKRPDIQHKLNGFGGRFTRDEPVPVCVSHAGWARS